MAEIDPNAIPFVPPTDIALIEPSTGRPKTAFHDWLTSLWDWMKRSVVDLTTKVTTVTDQVEDISAEVTVLQTAQADLESAFASYQVTVTAQFGEVDAAITTEASTRATADTALASSITTVDAKANNATASGAVYLAATSTPSGATAAYGWHLTAGSSYAGLSAIALSGGGSAIGITATQLWFTDSGTAQQVFAYSSGIFTFQVPVVIQSGTSGARQVITNENTKIYDSSNVLRVAIGINI